MGSEMCIRDSPYTKKEANFVLVEAIKGGKEEVKVEFPLVIYEKQGKYSLEVENYYKTKEKNDNISGGF